MTLKELLGDKWEDGIKVSANFYDTFCPKFKDKKNYYAGLKESGYYVVHNGTHEGNNWKIVKPTKKITLYRYTYEEITKKGSSPITQTPWTQDEKWQRYREGNWSPCPILIETKEIEISE